MVLFKVESRVLGVFVGDLAPSSLVEYFLEEIHLEEIFIKEGNSMVNNRMQLYEIWKHNYY